VRNTRHEKEVQQLYIMISEFKTFEFDEANVGSDVNGLIRASPSGLLQHLQLIYFRSKLDIEK
jgi:hypothetical protein